jgi:membrane protease YdiL (CAAX protease family)
LRKGLEIVIKVFGLYILMLGLLGITVNFLPTGGFILQDIVMIITVLFFFYAFDRKSGWTLGLTEDMPVKKFIGGALLGVLMITLSFAVIWLLGGLSVLEIHWDFVMTGEFTYWLILFLSVALAEELLSRGYHYGLIAHSYSKKAAIIVSAVLFALLHSMNNAVWSSPIPMLELFFAGVLFALIRIVTGGLWAPIGLHFTWNFFQGPVYGFEVSGLPMNSIVKTEALGHPLLSGGEFGAEGSIVGLTLTCIACLICYRYGKKKRLV